MKYISLICAIAILGSGVAGIGVGIAPFLHNSRQVTQSLYITPNAYDEGGDWGEIEVCANNSFAVAVQVKYLTPNNADEMAITGIKLFCSSGIDDHLTGSIKSTEGGDGEWYEMHVCSKSMDFLTEFRANVLPHNGGLIGDNVAVEDIEFYCDRELVDALPIAVPPSLEKNFNAGEWSDNVACDNNRAICGLQVNYHDGLLADKTGVDDLAFFCCDLP